ncbi:MAG: ribosome biogenesis GTPase YlqF [Lachnospiraceae bacterium]|uniref:Ribosome biogenesis GTPase A n=1 Tax=Candidatus Weimeria bifida TaxID=2599074 RepID=A0A6N7IX53_9FIRM|nr:ribosome biogenesis GTPase YlqF [Candidatus Weimeria bifida]RRF96109.1 MAG: ribosome biogenesis GTPase YlqF [Lachnospiraceae bacterium]
MNIQWYPGHMTKALRQIKEDIRLIDMVIELADARIPDSSRNPEIKNLTNGKIHILLLNKADLAEDAVTTKWIEYYKSQGIFSLALDSRSKAKKREIAALIDKASAEKRARDLRRGIKNRPVRALIAGIPNVGKSTLINNLAGKNSAKTGNKPGVTKGKQWIHVNKTLDLLDSPGILWPKFDDESTGEALALFGAISDDVFEKQELALILYHRMTELYPGRLNDFYGIDENLDDAMVLPAIAESRRLLAAGGALDLNRAANIFLDDLRSGRLGKVSFEKPD